jgi:hypothetical protein
MPPCGSCGRSWRAGDAGLRPRSFEYDHIETFDLIEPVAFGLKKTAGAGQWPRRSARRLAGKWNFGPVRLEKILIDVEALAETLEGGFESLHCILLFVVAQAFIVHAGDTEHHPKVAALGQELQ